MNYQQHLPGFGFLAFAAFYHLSGVLCERYLDRYQSAAQLAVSFVHCNVLEHSLSGWYCQHLKPTFV